MKKDKLKNTKNIMKKSPILYWCLLLLWTVLAVFLWINFFHAFLNVDNVFYSGAPTTAIKVLALVVLVLNAIFISYFWLNGVKDFVYVIWYFVFKKKLLMQYQDVISTNIDDMHNKVLLAYCTCNDFDEGSLEKSIKQDYDNFDVVILDDSSQEYYKKRIDEFAKSHNIKVVRRENRNGFKAGNINHYLMSTECKNLNYDYVVILDSDEILPKNFVKECFRYFKKYDNIGIVQANHISTRNRNFFMKLFHIGVNSHWPTYQTMKHFYGFSTMLGHGAMIKMECYYKSGGFPNLVAEDLCLSIEARKHGYFVAFAPNIICEEEYPIDYLAFRKRHSKWTQGNLEFIKKYTKRIAKSPMKWFEKLDIVLFTYNLPLTAIFAFFIFMNLLFVPILGIDLGSVYGMWMLAPTIIFFFSPMLNDVFTWGFRLNTLRFLTYFFCVIILYGSMLTTSLISAVLGMAGKKAQFVVTPKTSQKISLKFAIKSQQKEFIFSTILLVLALVVNQFDWSGVLSIILIVLTGYLSIILLFFSNKTYTKEQTAKIDEETSKISKKINKLYKCTQQIEAKNANFQNKS